MFDLERFRRAQEGSYGEALEEIRGGKKRGHWIWYIFPQMKGLGMSSVSDYYGMDGIGEARAYLADPVLGGRLREISQALLSLPEKNAEAVFGWPDVLKLRSSMTLFALAGGETEGKLFREVLDAYYGGQMDQKTLMLLRSE